DQARVWERSVEACCRMISFVAGSDAGIIIGFLKGPAREDIAGARKRFQKALERIAPKATRHRVKVLVEATNRYEAAVGNSLADTVALIEHLDCPWMRILPDTFHMNIEEADTHSALKRYAPFYESVHLSDNNRYLPGFGAIDFGSIFATLKQNEYEGMLALEGNLKIDLITDLETTISYLKPLLDV
ncbi:MAG: sugar phosphate isomerase/epimerase, partial [Chloroflexi bacterium]|nr:sugar phosphate isomerase/epimerase [Chloroflexota bacterium]